MNYDISVIIPVYNVEEYIRECLDSIVNQTRGIENIEVIVVNDCTPDNSMEIVRAYAEEYPSIKIVEHKKNKGPGPARNTGLKHATADYVTFVDPDDFITENTYELCLEKFEKYECDMVIYEYEYYSESGRKYPRNPSQLIFEENRLITDITKTPEIVFSTSSCNKVFPKKLKATLKFPPTRYEDIVPVITAIFSSKKIYVTNECRYYYRKRENNDGSFTDSFLEKTDSYRDRIFIHYDLYTLSKKYPDYKPLVDWINSRDSRLFLYSMVLKDVFSHKDRKEMFYKAKEYMEGVSEDTLNKFGPFWSELLRDAQTKAYWPFFFKYRTNYPKIINGFLRSCKRALEVFEISILTLISLFYKLNPKNRKTWLFCERPTEAKDSAYRFFQYMRENHPEINSYYLIDKHCETDYGKVKEIGNIVQYGSLKHKIYFILSEKLISGYKNFIEPWNYRNFKKYFQKVTPSKQYIFLPHGITKEDVSNVLGKRNHDTHFNLFLCAGKPEYDYVKNNFGYLPCEVAYTGFARFDHLHNVKTKNQIVLMPTWRNRVVQPSWIKEKIVNDEDFLDSQYYKAYQSLINNEKLIELLEENDFNLVFYPHFEVQKYLKYFESSSDRIVMADSDSYDIQTLLKESKLLITDYSSVFFDFGYMNKPLVYYQFDKDSYFKNHYKKGYFSYKDHGFGPVFEKEKDLINFIEKSFENKFSVDEKYTKRVNEFFILRDTNNCDRIYNEIINLKDQCNTSDELIKEIFENYEDNFEVKGLKIYHYRNYLMYVADSKRGIDKVWLKIFPEDKDELKDPNADFINLSFYFEDLCVTNNKQSKYKDKHIAIVKLPNIKIKEFSTGKMNGNEVNIIKRMISRSYPFNVLFNKNNTNAKNALINLKAYRIIKKKGLVDINYYLKNNGDIRASKIDPIFHYIYYGFKESRNPNPNFDNDYYLKMNEDVKNSNLNPLVHYVLYGVNENRAICKVRDRKRIRKSFKWS